jgi:hypothetical protein
VSLGALLAVLQDNPAIWSGLIGGVIGAVIVDVVHWRWEVRRRKHNGNGH